MGLVGVGRVRVEEDLDVVSGRDEGGRDGGVVESEGFLAGRGRWV